MSSTFRLTLLSLFVDYVNSHDPVKRAYQDAAEFSWSVIDSESLCETVTVLCDAIESLWRFAKDHECRPSIDEIKEIIAIINPPR